jgi:hypothetical protein
VAVQIARTGGERGDALAASAREVFRRLAAAMPPETSEKKKKKRIRDAFLDASRSTPPETSLLFSPLLARLFSSLLFSSILTSGRAVR